MFVTGVLTHDNPSTMYNQLVRRCEKNGELSTVSSFDVYELSPGIAVFENPYRRLVFSNPYDISVGKQCAKLLWMMVGRTDTEFLSLFQHPYTLQSDNHAIFSAPMGERMFMYGCSDLRGMTYNPVNQFNDASSKLMEDKNTNDAIVGVWNPHYENAAFFKDNIESPPVLSMMWKIRKNRLDCTVFCRKLNLQVDLFRDILFECGALHELMYSVLSYSKKYNGLEFGHLNVMSESMYTFTSETQTDSALDSCTFETEYEPKIAVSMEELSMLIEFLYMRVIPFLMDESSVLNTDAVDSLMGSLTDQYANGVTDEFWNTVIKLALAERLMLLGELEASLRVIEKTDVSSYTAQFLHSFQKHVMVKTSTACQSGNTFDDEYGDGAYERVSEQYAYLVRRQLGATVGENTVYDENIQNYLKWEVGQ